MDWREKHMFRGGKYVFPSLKHMDGGAKYVFQRRKYIIFSFPQLKRRSFWRDFDAIPPVFALNHKHGF